MKTIFITEKPSVAKAYQKVLQISEKNHGGYFEGYSPKLDRDIIITWAVGHLVGICPPDKQNSDWGGSWYDNRNNLPMIPETYKYEPLPDTAEQFRTIKSLYTRKDIEAIYYAGDSGREGIYIQALIRNQIFRTAPKSIDERVVWISSTSEQAILDGIKNAKPYTDYQLMIDSGYARAIADWLIGMNFTMAFTITSGGKGTVIKTGRVMTPTLAMIVDRQNEIESFVKTDFYGVRANDSIYWKAVEGSRYYDTPFLFNENGLKEKEKADALVEELNNDKKLTVADVKVQTKKEYAPLLFNLNDLQSYCSNAFRIPVAKVLEIAQELYESQYSMTTYPRTDSRYLDTKTQADLKKIGYNVPDRYVNDKKVRDHFAIIPTFNGNIEPSALPELHRKVYEVILKRFLDTMKDPFIYDTISITYKHSNGEIFSDSFRKTKQKGFKEHEQDKNINRKIPEKNDTITTGFSLRPMETPAPSVYTESTIISAMEKAGKLIEDEEMREQIKTCGIGTSATRSDIIEKLKNIKMIEVNSKTMVITPTAFGRSVTPIIRKYDETLVSPIKTADMEMKLKEIENGSLTVKQFQEELNRYVTETTHTILSENHTSVSVDSNIKNYNCPCCDKKLSYGRYGWYCSCGFSFGLEICGHKMKESDLESLIGKGSTKICSFKSKSGKSFKAKLVLSKDEHKWKFEFDNSAPRQNKCQSSTGNSAWGQKKSTSVNTGWGKKTSASQKSSRGKNK